MATPCSGGGQPPHRGASPRKHLGNIPTPTPAFWYPIHSLQKSPIKVESTPTGELQSSPAGNGLWSLVLSSGSLTVAGNAPYILKRGRRRQRVVSLPRAPRPPDDIWSPVFYEANMKLCWGRVTATLLLGHLLLYLSFQQLCNEYFCMHVSD